ncbi:unnamed protein product, partial [Symbiodinium pilosum]
MPPRVQPKRKAAAKAAAAKEDEPEEDEEPEEPEEAEAEDEDADEEPPMKKAKALPARGAVMAKAKAKAKAKGKAKAKAAPGRGGVIKAATKAAAKAIAAKEFAAVASKLKKTKSKETVAGEGKWYYMSDLRKMKVGTDDPKAWTAYNAKMNKQLETAYSKGCKQYTMTLGDKKYCVKHLGKLSKMVAMDHLSSSPEFVEVIKGANPGSAQKALSLLKHQAVKITGLCLDGGVAAEVQSESGPRKYTLRVGRASTGEVDARCSCVDFRTRGGLCKHGLAAALFLLQAGHELPEVAASGPQKRPRERPQATPTRNSVEQVTNSPEEVDEALPALKRPQFPKPKAASASAISQIQRGFFLRQLQTAAAGGNHASFTRDLQRITEPLGQDEASVLLHKAIHGNDAAGAEKVVQALIARPEGAAAVRAGVPDQLGRTPLHAAVAANRLHICRALLAANADPGLPDGHGVSAVELASRRKFDASKG